MSDLERPLSVSDTHWDMFLRSRAGKSYREIAESYGYTSGSVGEIVRRVRGKVYGLRKADEAHGLRTHQAKLRNAVRKAIAMMQAYSYEDGRRFEWQIKNAAAVLEAALKNGAKGDAGERSDD